MIKILWEIKRNIHSIVNKPDEFDHKNVNNLKKLHLWNLILQLKRLSNFIHHCDNGLYSILYDDETEFTHHTY